MDTTLYPISYDPTLCAKLRTRLKDDGLNGFLIPHADAHQSESLPPGDERLARLTGFSGSAGFAIVLEGVASVFVDGRYTLQAANEVDSEVFAIHHSTETPAEAWLKDHLKPGDEIGYDPWLHTPQGVARFSQACIEAGAKLVACAENPIDALWHDRPPPPATTLEIHDIAYAGRTSAEKRAIVAQALKEQKVDAVILGAGDSIAWLFNIRASDVPYTPLVLAFALLGVDGRATLFIDAGRVNEAVAAHLGPDVVIAAPDQLATTLESLGNHKAHVLVPHDGTAAWLSQHLERSRACVLFGDDPCAAPRAAKTPTEIDGMTRAHVRDGVAMARFLAWLDETVLRGDLSELSAAAKLDALRGENALFRGLSFPTISAAGPNAAIVHYRVGKENDRTLEPGTFYLVDSGAQYQDGTTDVTRTVAIGPPSAEMKDRFTRVLKGHIALARQRFPKGTCARQLDVLARHPLWDAGLDYDHGTGHGVGVYLSVHEGPQRIAKRGPDVALKIGMVTSNEPGYYKAGAYGIRIENLVTVCAAAQGQDEEREMLAFEPLTLVPIDLNAIAPELMTETEKNWLNAYHAHVRTALSPLLEGYANAWLKKATRIF